MCGGGFDSVINMFTNPLANIKRDFFGGDSSGGLDAAQIQALNDTQKKKKDALTEEARQKQLEAGRINRKATILTNSLATNSSGQKTLLGQ